jgi:hypothetical protein
MTATTNISDGVAVRPESLYILDQHAFERAFSDDDKQRSWVFL